MLQEPDRVWRQSLIASEVMRHGWIDADARVPDAAVRAATQRLAAAGLAKKVAPGSYQLTERGKEVD